MWLDALALVVLFLFGLTGAVRGTLPTTAKLVCILGAYGAAIWIAPALGPPLAERMSLPALLGTPLAGTIVFVAAYGFLGAIAFGLQVMERRWRGDYPRTPADRIGGVVVGIVRGGLVVLLLGWLALWLDGLRVAGGQALIPAPGPSALASVTREAVEVAGGLAIGRQTAEARVTTQLMARPGESLLRAQRLLDNPRIVALRNDPVFWSRVADGSTAAALNRPSFLGIAYDATLRQEFAELGLVRPHDAEDPRLFAAAMKEVLDEAAPRIRELMRDPELHAVLADPEVEHALREGDALTLLQHRGFQALVGRVASGSGAE